MYAYIYTDNVFWQCSDYSSITRWKMQMQHKFEIYASIYLNRMDKKNGGLRLKMKDSFPRADRKDV